MFDLGLALSFQDNASKGLKNMIGTMQDLTESVNETMGKLREFSAIEEQTGKNLSAMKDMAMGTLLTQVGSTINNVGKGIAGTFTGAMESVLDASKEVHMARITIDNLWGSAEKGAEAFKKMKDYAMTSTFEFNDLLSTMTMMKAVGIDINDNLSTTSGRTQKITDYAGDLAALFPDMRNQYGTGIRAAMGAIKEFVAEGNTRSLLTGAGLDIQTILGEKKGGDIATRSRQIADLVEKINAFGMTANMMGEPSQRLSNLSDIIFNLKYQMGEAGNMYAKYSGVIKNLLEPLNKISDEDWEGLGKSLGSAFDIIVNPLVSLSKVVGEMIPKFVTFIKMNPWLAKLAVTIGTIGGVALILGGTLLTLGGSLRLMQFAYKGLIPLQKSFLSLLGKTNLLAKATYLSIAKWAVVAYLVYQAYQKNFGGIKDLLTDVLVVTSSVFQALSSGKINGEDFAYLKQRGLVSLVADLALFGSYIQEMFVGIGEGIKTAGNELIDFLDSFSEFTGIDLSGVVRWIRDFMDSFTKRGNMAEIARIRDLWKDFGNVIGKFIIPLILAKSVFSTVGKALWTITTPLRWIFSLLTKSKSIMGSFGNVLMWFAGQIGKSQKIMSFLFRTFGMQGSKFIISLMQGLWGQAAKTLLGLIWNGVGMLFSKLKGFVIQTLWRVILVPLVQSLAAFFGISFGAMAAALLAVFVVIGGIIYLTVTGQWGKVDAWLTEKFGTLWTNFRDKCKEAWDTIVSWWNGFNFWNTGLGRFINDVSEKIKGWASIFSRESYSSSFLNKPIFGGEAATPVKAATGGEINGEGLTYLHPNEFVANSDITKGLKRFLKNTTNVNYGGVNISINVDHMDNDTDLNSLADKLMRIMDRKMQLRQMALRV